MEKVITAAKEACKIAREVAKAAGAGVVWGLVGFGIGEVSQTGLSDEASAREALQSHQAIIDFYEGPASLSECRYRGLVRDKFTIFSTKEGIDERWQVAVCRGPGEEPTFKLLRRTPIKRDGGGSESYWFPLNPET